MRRWAGLGLIVVVVLLAACDPEPEPPPPPPPTGTVVVYGDSLVVESVDVLYERFPEFVANTNLVVRSRDPDKLNAAMGAVKEMLANLNATR